MSTINPDVFRFYDEAERFELVIYPDGSVAIGHKGKTHAVRRARLSVMHPFASDPDNDYSGIESVECDGQLDVDAADERVQKALDTIGDVTEAVDRYACTLLDLGDGLAYVNDQTERTLRLREELLALAGAEAEGLAVDDREVELAASLLYAFPADSVRFGREEAGELGHVKSIRLTRPRTLRLRFADVMNHPITVDVMNDPNAVVVGNVVEVELS